MFCIPSQFPCHLLDIFRFHARKKKRKDFRIHLRLLRHEFLTSFFVWHIHKDCPLFTFYNIFCSYYILKAYNVQYIYQIIAKIYFVC